jgi:hypothetical protein
LGSRSILANIETREPKPRGSVRREKWSGGRAM